LRCQEGAEELQVERIVLDDQNTFAPGLPFSAALCKGTLAATAARAAIGRRAGWVSTTTGGTLSRCHVSGPHWSSTGPIQGNTSTYCAGSSFLLRIH
jgi:hypothetical protein